MKYIKKDDNKESIYEVLIDENSLKELVKILDKYLSVTKYKEGMIPAYFVDEANKKLVSEKNNADIPVNILYEVNSLTSGPYWYNGKPLDASYSAISLESVGLVRIINSLIDYSKTDIDVTTLINELDNYPLSDDFLPFDLRVEKEDIKLNELLKKNDKNVLQEIKVYLEKVIEAKLNNNYSFDLLHNIYEKVLYCIKYKLIEETKISGKTR